MQRRNLFRRNLLLIKISLIHWWDFRNWNEVKHNIGYQPILWDCFLFLHDIFCSSILLSTAIPKQLQLFSHRNDISLLGSCPYYSLYVISSACNLLSRHVSRQIHCIGLTLRVANVPNLSSLLHRIKENIKKIREGIRVIYCELM